MIYSFANFVSSDSVVGYVVLPLACWMIQNGYQMTETSCIVENTYELIGVWMVNVSSCSIVFIAYDRYLLITRFTSYHTILTNRRVTITIFSYWILIFPLALATNYSVHFYVWYNIAGITFPIVFLFGSYFFIWKAIRQSRRRVATNTISDRHQAQREIILAKKVSIIIIGYIIALSPAIIFLVLVQVSQSNPGLFSIDFIGSAFLFMAFMGLSNSCINPMIYVGSDPIFRKVCKQLLRIYKEPSDSETCEKS